MLMEVEPNTILKYDFSYCLKEIVLSGNRFPLFKGFTLYNWWSLASKLRKLTLFEVSYNSYSMGNVRFRENFPHQRVYGFDKVGMNRIRNKTSQINCDMK